MFRPPADGCRSYVSRGQPNETLLLYCSALTCTMYKVNLRASAALIGYCWPRSSCCQSSMSSDSSGPHADRRGATGPHYATPRHLALLNSASSDFHTTEKSAACITFAISRVPRPRHSRPRTPSWPTTCAAACAWRLCHISGIGCTQTNSSSGVGTHVARLKGRGTLMARLWGRGTHMARLRGRGTHMARLKGRGTHVARLWGRGAHLRV